MRGQFQEPIALVGIGCRFPGGPDTPDSFWQFLVERGNGICVVPEDRWALDGFFDPDPTAIARSTTKWGGFLDDVRRFDPEFFEITPREANSMDPQQRILLMVVYEALRDASLRVADIQAGKTGVFVGVSTSDYATLQRYRRTSNEIYAGTGTAMSIVANRISHRLNLSGPSFSLDTACSSSLVALDQACRHLDEGTCSHAIVGGVQVLADPGAFVAFSKAGMLSPTGTISTFDSAANGYVRGEGCGAVILKRLSDARRAGDRIYAVIRATSVNQDGRTPTLTAPDPNRQFAMLETLCRRADADPASIDYVEAHGTGTPVGDPVEAFAVGRVFGMCRDNDPVLVGSVKPNIGHLEAAAGISGLIKSALVVHRRQVPPNRNFRTPNPNIPFEALGIRVPTELTPIGNGVARAAVNSFGFGGTNASALLESDDAAGAVPARLRGSGKPPKAELALAVVPVSAATEPSLRAYCGRLAAELRPGGSLADASLSEIAANLAAFPDTLRNRAVLLAKTPGHLAELLTQVAGDDVPEPEPRTLPNVILGRAGARPGIAFTFAGQGGQWWAMARQLLSHDGPFRAAVKEFDSVFREISGWSILTELRRSETRTRVHDPIVTQPAIFAVQTGLAAFWARAGVRPDLVVGHSFGEVAAAYYSGALTLESAAGLIHKRGLVAEMVDTPGAMLAVGLGADQLGEYLPDGDDIDIAAFNGPTMVTLSGTPAAIEAVDRRLTQERPDVLVRRLAMTTAWHSQALDPAEAWFRDGVGDLAWRAPDIPLISTVTGKLETCLDTDYWWANLRQPVAYQAAVEQALDLGATLFLEIGPHRTLSGLTATTASARDRQVIATNSLFQAADDAQALGCAGATLFRSGVDVDWSAFVGQPSRRLRLPKYQWDEIECWADSEESRQALGSAPVHPLLGTRSPGPDVVWENEVNLSGLGYIADHTINGNVIFPAAGYMDIIAAAGLDFFGHGPIEVEGLTIQDALFIGQDDDVLLRTVFDPDSGRIRVHSRLRDSAPGWRERAAAILRRSEIETPPPPVPGKARPLHRMERAEFYALADRHGYEYGPNFQGADDIAIRATGVEARIDLGDRPGLRFESHAAHPAVLDACMQTAIPLADLAEGLPLTPFGDEGGKETRYPLYLPVGTDRIRLFSPLRARARVFVRTRRDRDGSNVAGYTIVDDRGAVCMTIEGFRSQRMAGENGGASEKRSNARFYCETFVPMPAAAAEGEPEAGQGEAGDWLVLADAGGVCKRIASRLTRGGASVTVVGAGRDGAPDFAQAVAEWLPTAGSNAGILVGLALDTAKLDPDASTADMQRQVERNVLGLFSIGSALDLLREAGPQPSVWMLTKGARTHPDDAPMTTGGLAQAPLTGMMRTLASELREFPHRHIDFADMDRREVGDLVDLLRDGTQETEILLRRGARFVPRLEAPADDALPRRVVMVRPHASDANFVATMAAPGSLDDIRLEESALGDLGPDDLRIAVKAVGLNFRDIMAATGLLPKEAERDPAWKNLGVEFSGQVVATGKKVRKFAVGDRVMGMGRRCLQAYLDQPSSSGLAKVPDGLTYEDAATVPSAFATAHYALNHIGRMRKGERVFIHVATGGVGLAAIQLAKRAGAEIFATAGSDEKRAYLKKLGVRHVMNSRSLDFADKVMELTGGQGVDILLNSLPGDFIRKGLDILAPYGRFLEIGKRDIYADSLIGMKALRKNATLAIIDLAAMGEERPELLGHLAEEVRDMMAASELKPLPATAFPVNDASGAFRYMSQARHIGKVVVTTPAEPVSVLCSPDRPFTLRSDRSYLVTGGSRGFGITVSDFLSACGAGRLVLASRSGRPDPDAADALAAIEARGTEVVHLKLDITDESAVSEAVAALANAKKPLAGIVHGAAVIIDGFLAQLDHETFRSVLRPKIMGAWNLHRALIAAGAKVDFFVSFSSLAQVLGSIGQANYVAANAFLDAFAGYRRGQGLAGQTIDWGALGESGFVARSDSMTNYLESMGMTPIGNVDAVGGLQRFLQLDLASAAFAAVDWASVSRSLAEATKIPRMRGVLETKAGGGSRIRAEVATAPRDHWPVLLQAFLVEEVAKVLKIGTGDVGIDRSLTELGFDSLSSIELKNRVEGQLGLSIPVGAFLQTPTLGGLGATIAESLEAEVDKRTEAAGRDDETGSVAGRRPAARRAHRSTPDQVVAVAASTGALASAAGQRLFEHRALLGIRAGLDVASTRRAFDTLVRRHPLLRLGPRPDGATGGWDLSLTARPKLAVVEDAATALADPLAVQDGEFVRAVMAQDRREWHLGLLVHAAVSDDHGFSTLVADLLALIDGRKLAAKPADKALREALAARADDEVAAESVAARAHWEAFLMPWVGPLPVPARRRALVPMGNGANRGPMAELSFDLTGKRASGAAETVVLAAFTETLARRFDRPDLVVDRYVASPTPEPPTGIVGPFERRFPIVVRNFGTDDGTTPAVQIGRQIRTGLRHAARGTAFVLEALSPDHQAAAALSQFGFRFGERAPAAPLAPMIGKARVGGKPVRLLDSASAVGHAHDLLLDVSRARGGLKAMLRFDTDAFAERDVREIAEQFAQRVAAGVEPSGRAASAAPRHVRADGRGRPATRPEKARGAGRGASQRKAANGTARTPVAAAHANGAANGLATVSDAPAAANGSGVRYFPVTPNQRRVLDTLTAPDATATLRLHWWNVYGLLISQKLDIARLRRAATQVTDLHEGLRTHFRTHDGEWQAVVAPRHPTGLVVEDYGNVTDDEFRAIAERCSEHDCDVEEGPLFDIRLLRFGDRGDAIVLFAHHAVADGTALITIFEHLLAAYLGMPLSPAAGSTASLLRMTGAGGNRGSHREHWKSILEPWLPAPAIGRGAKGLPLNLSGGFVAPKEILISTVEGERFEKLVAAAKTAGVSTNSVLMAAFAKALGTGAGVDELYMATIFPRRAEDLTDVVAFLSANLAFRADLGRNATIARIAGGLQEQANASYPLLDLGFSMSDLFDEAPDFVGGVNRIPMCTGLAPGHLARQSPLEPLLTGTAGTTIRFGAMDLTTLPIPTRSSVPEEITLRPMGSRAGTTLRLAYETIAFDRAEAENIVDEMLGLIGIARPRGGRTRSIERLGARADWEAVARGEMPPPVNAVPGAPAARTSAQLRAGE